jgi:TolA-binding protein
MSAVRRLAVLAAAGVMTGGCFATRSDVRLLQDELRASRAMASQADSAHRQQLTALSRSFSDEVARLVEAQRRSSDSLRLANQRILALQVLATEQFRTISEQNYQVAEMMKQLGGQFARRAAAALEQAAPPPAAPDAGAAATGAGAGGAAGTTTAPTTPTTGAGTPGPATLLSDAVESLRANACTSARRSLDTFLTTYPNDPQASEALFYVGESYGSCGSARNTAAADSVYRLVVSRYPASPRAPSALYKRAQLLLDAGRNTEGRQLLDEVIQRYRRSDEAFRACELLGRTARCP